MDNAEIGLGIVINVFKILTRAGNDKDFANEGGCIKTERNDAKNVLGIQILGNLVFIKHIADIATVSFIPAEAIHVLAGVSHLPHKRSIHYVFHLFDKTSFSYFLTSAK